MTDTMDLQDLPEEVRDELQSLANVTGTGIGLKQTDEEGMTDRESVIVFVETKLPRSQLDEDDVVPEEIEIDGETYSTDVVESGEIRALAVGVPEPPIEMDSPTLEIEESGELAIPEDLDRKKKWRPAPAGVSVGHPQVTAGTLGTPPLENRDGKMVFLTNCHVAAASGDASIGDTVLQPGKIDGGVSPNDDIGTLLEFGEIEFGSGSENTTDSALVEVVPDHLQYDLFELRENLRGWSEARIGRVHTKSGRTTAVTEGRCTARNANFAINFGAKGIANFVGLDVFEVMGAGGDSGSLMGFETAEGLYGTSLLFAGSTQLTLGIPMRAVQAEHGSLTVMTSQSLVEPDDLRITGTAFRGALGEGATSYRWSGPWARQYSIDFQAHPTTGNGYVRSSVDGVYNHSAGTYYLVKVENRQSNQSVRYDVRYVVTR